MSKFPSSIPLPDTIQQTREERRKEMIATSRRGVAIRFTIILAELLGFVYFNSSSLLLDALSSLIDVAASVFLIFCIHIADKPPDKEHPFGHGRFEPIAGLQLGLLLIVIGCGMCFQQISALTKDTLPGAEINPYTWIIPLVALVLLETCYRLLKKAGKKRNSPALLADAVHYRIDGLNCLFATIALILASIFPASSVMLDHLGALVIAVVMIGIGAYAAKGNLNQLLDKIPHKSYFEKVKNAALNVEGVLSTEKLRLQVYGPDAHVGIDIEVDPLLSVEDAHTITQKVRAEIQKAWPQVRDVIVHVEPYYPDDHEVE